MAFLPRKILKIISAPAERLFNIFKFNNTSLEYRNTEDVVIIPQIEDDIDYEIIKNGVFTIEDIYLLGLVLLRQQKYLYQEGLPAWHEKEEYFKGSKVKVVNTTGTTFEYKEYISQTNNNIGNDPTQDTFGINWKLNSGSTPTPGGGDIVETITDNAGNSSIVFSNGFCIQNFIPFTPSTNPTYDLIFLKQFANTHYTVQITLLHNNSQKTGAAVVEMFGDRTVDGTRIYNDANLMMQITVMGFVQTI